MLYGIAVLWPVPYGLENGCIGRCGAAGDDTAASAIPSVLLGERVTPRVLATASTDGLQAFSRPRVRNKSGVVPDLFRPEAAQVNGVGSMGRG